jgi:hypothetical protein
MELNICMSSHTPNNFLYGDIPYVSYTVESRRLQLAGIASTIQNSVFNHLFYGSPAMALEDEEDHGNLHAHPEEGHSSAEHKRAFHTNEG